MAIRIRVNGWKLPRKVPEPRYSRKKGTRKRETSHFYSLRHLFNEVLASDGQVSRDLYFEVGVTSRNPKTEVPNLKEAQSF